MSRLKSNQDMSNEASSSTMFSMGRPSNLDRQSSQQQQQQQQQYPSSSSSSNPHSTGGPNPNLSTRTDDSSFDIFIWHPKFVSCQRYFLDHAQHSGPVQSVCAFLNIQLPYQRDKPTVASPISDEPRIIGINAPSYRPNPLGGTSSVPYPPAPSLSLTPYIRRLVVTGLDFPGVLHGFFGDDWASGIGPLHEQERRNYMFAAKSGGWASVKNAYDMSPLETVPFLRPLQGVVEQEVSAAERSWSEFMAFEDWMIGPRAPENGDDCGNATSSVGGGANNNNNNLSNNIGGGGGGIGSGR